MYSVTGTGTTNVAWDEQYIGTYRHSKATIHTIDATVESDERTEDIILAQTNREERQQMTARVNIERKPTRDRSRRRTEERNRRSREED